MMKVFILPAYGRKYSTLSDMLTDWNTGKDFRLDSGEYCSIRDLEAIQELYWAEDVVLVCPVGRVSKVLVTAKVCF